MSSTAPVPGTALVPGIIIGGLLGTALGVIVIGASQAAVTFCMANDVPLAVYLVVAVCAGLACAALIGWLVHTRRIGTVSALLAALMPLLVYEAWSRWAMEHYGLAVLFPLSPVLAAVGILAGLGAGLARRGHAYPH